ncbi:MAG: hypothetical protein Sv326_0973 [Candidatus Fermentimicrarchaeum limneticum]|uniref:Uncharacterized protein n=1 Tax=Fermentimicrarchaeum limneticum TaxID=2795018 RepID=A0A7D5XM49_FERL1|nr:MAG: hypothetical protein Sv326_0973 [Candidatus Fermentimicrarchaeum limneticum]
MKAQVAVEFLTAYGWALLAVIVAAVAAFYFLSATQSIPSECNFGNSFQCTSYQFIKNSDGTMKLTFQMTNSLGKRILLYNRKQIIQVQNIGKSGINNYTGVCVGSADIVQSGGDIVCMFNITDKQFTPSVGKISAFTVLLNYTNCDTSSVPSSCINGMNRSFQGKINSDLELAPTIVAPRCKDMKCDTGENYTNCPWDCPSPRPSSVQVSWTADCAHNFIAVNTGVYEINVTVRDQSTHTMSNVPVYIQPVDVGMPAGLLQEITYQITPPVPLTDANGLARANFSWSGCSCCIDSYFGTCSLVLFEISATAGDAIGYNHACGMLDQTSMSSLGCCSCC